MHRIFFLYFGLGVMILSSGVGLHPYIRMVPFMAMFATTLLSQELTSTDFSTPFHFIAAKLTGFGRPPAFMAGHIVSNIGITDIRKLMKNCH